MIDLAAQKSQTFSVTPTNRYWQTWVRNSSTQFLKFYSNHFDSFGCLKVQYIISDSDQITLSDFAAWKSDLFSATNQNVSTDLISKKSKTFLVTLIKSFWQTCLRETAINFERLFDQIILTDLAAWNFNKFTPSVIKLIWKIWLSEILINFQWIIKPFWQSWLAFTKTLIKSF